MRGVLLRIYLGTIKGRSYMSGLFDIIQSPVKEQETRLRNMFMHILLQVN